MTQFTIRYDTIPICHYLYYTDIRADQDASYFSLIFETNNNVISFETVQYLFLNKPLLIMKCLLNQQTRFIPQSRLVRIELTGCIGQLLIHDTAIQEP